MIKLGDKARDKITGFQGICVCRSEYISGCVAVSLQPPVGKDGTVPEQGHFDEPMCEVVQAKSIPALSTDNGGPRPAPSHHAEPRR